MATKTIGSAVGRDYAVPADWFAAIPATLTANEVGNLYNDSEFIFTSTQSYSGKTVGAFTITLQPAAGQGFADTKANVGWKLSYVATQGVAFKCTAGYVNNLVYNLQAGMTVQGIQVKTTAANSSAGAVEQAAAAFKNCIFDDNHPSYVFRLNPGTGINCLAISRGGGIGVHLNYGSAAYNCTAVVPAGGVVATNGIYGANNANTVVNCASFGFTNAFAFVTAWSVGSNYNAASDATAPGANSQQSKLFANQFVSTTDDFRLKALADCIDRGNTDATNAPADIVGTTRGVGLLGDIGVWEYVAAGVSGTLASTLGAITAALSGTTTIVGSISAALANTTASISGTVTDPGALNASLGNVTGSITGSTSTTGVLASTLDAIVGAVIGTTTVVGSMASTLADVVGAFYQTITTTLSDWFHIKRRRR
jgi:hypothetical protein